jgi:hypothetical protein
VTSRPPAPRRASAILAFVGALALLVVLRWPTRARALYEWDSAQYALATVEFDVYKHQPHPPGYPLWVLMLRGVVRLGFDHNAAQIVLALVFGAAAIAAFMSLARRLLPIEATLVTTATLVFAPGFILYCCVAANYTTDVFVSSAIALLAARLWSGEKHVAPWACALLAAMAGVRQSGAVLMAPLLAVAMMRALRFDVRAWARTMGLGIPVFLAWYLPTARVHGGVMVLARYSAINVRSYFESMSVLYGAPAAVHREMARNSAIWLAMDLVVPMMLALALAALRRTVADAEVTPDPNAARPAWHTPLFYALWGLPNLLYVFLLHSPKPGYLLLGLPPMLLLIGCSFARSLPPIARRLGTTGLATASAFAAIVACASTVIASRSYSNDILERSSIDGVRVSDADTAAILSIVRDGPGGAADTIVFGMADSGYGPTTRALGWYLPETRVWMLGPVGMLGDVTIPDTVRRLVWIDLPGAPFLAAIRRDLRAARLLYQGRTISIMVADIGVDEVNARISWDQWVVHLIRGVSRPEVDAWFEEGFSGPESNADQTWVWANGPRARFVVHLDQAATLRVELTVAVNPVRDQRIHARLGPKPLATFEGIDPQKPLVFEFRAEAGDNPITLSFEAWNRHPDEFAPRDPRTLAVAFRQILVEVDGHPLQMVQR